MANLLRSPSLNQTSADSGIPDESEFLGFGISSMLAALTAIALICGLEQPLPYRLLVIAGGIYVIVRHRTNIQRLLAGTEPRLGQGSPESKAQLQI
jgi:hypothetical protein